MGLKMGIHEKILAYLSVYGKENRYRLARALKIGMNEITKALIDLEKKGKIEMKGGRAFLVKGKKPVTVKEKKRKKKPKEVKEEQPVEEENKEEIQPIEKPEEEQPKTEEIIEEKPEEIAEEPKEEQPKEVLEEPIKGVIKEERIEGTVKFFNLNKGFGFITGDDGKEYYVHESGLKEGVTIGEDDRVSFKVVQGDKGPKAEEVEKIS